MSDIKELKGFKIGDRVVSLRKDNVTDEVKDVFNKRGKIVNFYNTHWVEIEFNEDVMTDRYNEKLTRDGNRVKNNKRVYWVKIEDLRKDKLSSNGRFDKEMVVEDSSKMMNGFRIGDRVISLKDNTIVDPTNNVFPLKNKKGYIVNFYSDYWVEVEFDENVIDDRTNDKINRDVSNRVKRNKRSWWVKFNDLRKSLGGSSKYDKSMFVEAKEVHGFKVGDRVIRTNRSLSHYGKKATIRKIYDSHFIIIEFDEKINDGDEFNGITKPGYGWSCDYHSIEKIKNVSNIGRFNKTMTVENFKSFIDEDTKRSFKVGDRVIGIGNHDNRSLDGRIGTVAESHTYDVGVCWDENIKGHDCGGRCKDGHGWNVPKEQIRKYMNKGRFDKDMVVEVVEPGQETSEGIDKFSIHIKNNDEYKRFQLWAFKNGYIWSHGERKVEEMLSNNILTFDFKNKRSILRGNLKYHKTKEAISAWGNVFEFEDFMSMMEYDDRVKVKPSQMKNMNEVVEPGQETSEGIDKFSVHVTNAKESKQLQEWLFKNEFIWNGRGKEYDSNPINSFGTETMIVFDNEDKKIRYGKTSSKNVKAYGELYKFDEFFDLISGDARFIN